MTPTVVGLLVAAVVFAAAIVGLQLHRVLPPTHLLKETQDVVRLGVGTVSVLASLVFGLLITTAKGTADAAEREMRAFAADLVVTDQILRDYGPGAAEGRAQLRRFTARVLADVWPEVGASFVGPDGTAAHALLERTRAAIRVLAPADDGGRRLQEAALASVTSLLRQSWALIEAAEPTVRPLVVVVVVSWVAAIFVSFGLAAPRNGTVYAAFLACSLSIGAAVFLIVELDDPFRGVMRLSSRPMLDALARLGP